MKNKVLIKLSVPEINGTFDIFIPTNELIWKIKKLIVKSVNDLTGESLDLSKDYVLLNAHTGQVYTNNITIFETDIRNATELVLILQKSN